ncbi:MAG: alpha-L-rhamnosidase-related protein [Pirellulaceae bacterium]
MTYPLSLWSTVFLSLVLCLPVSWTTGAAPVEAPQAQVDLNRTLNVDQLSLIRFGNDTTGKWRPHRATLDPAKWIWLPSERTLPNTFVLFRKEVLLTEKPSRAVGWMTADSRYRLTVNGQRVQWGPAPCDPRQLDVDPFDITAFLRPGKNVIGVEVLYFGIGEGTWAAGKPGLLFHAVLTTSQADSLRVVSDESWHCLIDRAHRPAQPKRWFLRALQEEFDARQHPFGWDTPEFALPGEWVPAMLLACPADKPSSCSSYSTTDSLDQAAPSKSSLRARQIPLVQETSVAAKALADSGQVNWRRDPRDWFDFRMPDSFEIVRPVPLEEIDAGTWRLPTTTDRTGMFATFEFAEQIVGFPYVEIDAPAGTVVELITQEAHDPQATAWMDNHFYAWSRFICREGVNRFEAFDYESLRWLQLHVHNAGRPVIVRNVGVRRRMFPWTHQPVARCSDPALQKLFDASVNTLYNSAIETAVDGMGRERQQYSGDGGHQLLAIRSVLGEPRIASRFLRTFSEGLTPDGYFLDCWPAYDRLVRVAQKQIDGTYWGPLLDHGVGFNFDCWNHYMETGDRSALAEPYPRLVRFAEYLANLRGPDGLLPVEDLGIPTVWIDHDAYRSQRDKQCAFNLYAAAMFQQALAPMAELFGDADRSAQYRRTGSELREATVLRYWSDEHGLFVDNLPWLAEDGAPRTSDRTLATSILFDQCPAGRVQPAADELAECPSRMGFSYPCNAGWRLWALAKMGRGDLLLSDLRSRWATMRSVRENNTLQEGWMARPDSREQWSHCAVVPLYVLAQDIAGIRPTAPGYARCQIRPQLGDLHALDLVVHTAHGPLRFTSRTEADGCHLRLDIPGQVNAELVVPDQIATSGTLPAGSQAPGPGLQCFKLKSGTVNEVVMQPR